MPPRDSARPGLRLLVAAGMDYEAKKFSELAECFGDGAVLHNPEREPVLPPQPEDFIPADDAETPERVFMPFALESAIARLKPGDFLVEAYYDVGAVFRTAHGIDDLERQVLAPRNEGLAFADSRPDIIEVLAPAGEKRLRIDPRGDYVDVEHDDTRLGLRVIDVKLTAEPSPAYFAEIAYYSMTLAAWLEERGYSDRFIVLAESAVWPGKHEASEMRELELRLETDGGRVPTSEEYHAALLVDIETMPEDIFTARVRRFFSHDLRMALTPQDWRDLDWHVDTRCGGCDYLGYRWTAREPDARMCWPQAEAEGHVSRVAGISTGARKMLGRQDVIDLTSLAHLSPGSPVYETHQTLRAGRTVIAARAGTFVGREGGIPDRAGTSASLPRWSDVRVAISVDFDIGSGISFAFGWQAVQFVKRTNAEGSDVFRAGDVLVVRNRSIREEGALLRDFLLQVFRFLRAARDRNAGARVQILLWDLITYEHLRRIVGRHLAELRESPDDAADAAFGELVWLFPPDGVVRDPDYVGKDSPITIVSTIVKSLLAVAVPHHYGLLPIARSYHPARLVRDGAPPGFLVNSFFVDPLSDQIPSERAHEIWERVREPQWRHHQRQEQIMRSVVKTRLEAIMGVAERLGTDLRSELVAQAPPIGDLLAPTSTDPSVSADGQLWAEHQRLLVSAQGFEVDTIRAMPPHEREARFRSIRLERRIVDSERAQVLRDLGVPAAIADDDVYVFGMSDRSRDARVKAGDFDFSLFPEDMLSVQYMKLGRFIDLNFGKGAMRLEGYEWRKRMIDACEATVVQIDRARCLIAVRCEWKRKEATFSFVRELLNAGLFDFEVAPGRYAILDPRHTEFFLKKLRKALAAIGDPPLARQASLVTNAGLIRPRDSRRRRKQTAPTPADRFIWDATALAAEHTGVDVEPALQAMARLHPDLVPQQKEALRAAAHRRLALIWGPPGTGKSRTSVALVAALVMSAQSAGRPLRILVTAHTWVAIDNVASKLKRTFAGLGIGGDVEIFRPVSNRARSADVHEDLADALCDRNDEKYARLKLRLTSNTGITIVASTPDQVGRLVEAVAGDPDRPRAALFDRIILDEASQMDVAHAIVVMTAFAEDAAMTVVGDELQMAPIHALPPPEGLESVVGSIYDFYRHYRSDAESIEPTMLTVNFRSNQEIVALVRRAGYGDRLTAAYPTLRMRLCAPLPTDAPAEWPPTADWSPAWVQVLDPERPIVAIVHGDDFSSQRNEGEARTVASLVRALYGRLADGLHGEDHPTDNPLLGTAFFQRGVGVVTPHRAQQAEVLRRLDMAMPPEVDRRAIYDAVDTVERFQGQEKDVMIASFGLGDLDQIAAEEEFIYSLNRFNVVVSRARAKLIVLLSRKLVDHLPHGVDLLRESRLLKSFADGYLRRESAARIPGFDDEVSIKYV